MANVVVVIHNNDPCPLPVVARHCADITLHAREDCRRQADVKILPFVWKVKSEVEPRP